MIYKTIIRWGVLLTGMVAFLTYLKSALYRAWLAGGPPTDNPEGWLFSAENSLSWAFAFLSLGIGIFLLIGKLPSLSRVAFVFIALSIILGVFPSAREFVASDVCLDSGGRWSSSELRCNRE